MWPRSIGFSEGYFNVSVSVYFTGNVILSGWTRGILFVR